MEGTSFMKNGEHRVSISPSVVLNSQLTLGVRKYYYWVVIVFKGSGRIFE